MARISETRLSAYLGESVEATALSCWAAFSSSSQAYSSQK